jgi:GntR family transcriptional regulator
MAKLPPPRKSPPLHVVISEKLRTQIKSGKYAAGDQIPSEHQLMAQFGVSRITVRQAIANLVQQGLVVVQRGRGAFIKEQHKAIYSLSNPIVFFEDDLARQGFTSAIENLVFEAIAAPEPVCQQLQLPALTSVYFQKKLLLIDAVPAALDVTYLLFDLGAAHREALCQAMTFPTLERHGLEIQRIEANLESAPADTELSQYLDVPLGGPILVYRYLVFAGSGQPILCGETLSRGDRLGYSVSLVK